MISYLLPTVRLIRPLNIWITFCAVLLGGWLALLQLQPEMFVASLSAALIAAAGYIQNDLIDIAADRVSHPHRPLPRRELPPSFARALSAFGYAGGIDPDHTPGISDDTDAMQMGWAYAVGQLRALRLAAYA